MSTYTVVDLATELRKPVAETLGHLREAGISVSNEKSPISPSDKMLLLTHLRQKSIMQPTHPAAHSAAQANDPRRITLKRKETTELRLGGGRGLPSKTVSIEVRKKRTYVKQDEMEGGSVGAHEAAGLSAASASAAPAASAGSAAPVEQEIDHEAIAAREAAEREAAARAEAEAAAHREQEEAARKQREEEEARQRAEAAEAERKRLEEQERLKNDPIYRARMEAEASRRRAEENLRRATEVRPAPPPPPPPPPTKRDAGRATTSHGPGGNNNGGRKELHLGDNRGGNNSRRDKKSKKPTGHVRVDSSHGFERPTAPVVREVEVPEAISVGELANRMAVKATELIKMLMRNGLMATINQSLDQDTAVLMVEEMGHKPRTIKDTDVEEGLMQAAAGETRDLPMQPRPPVVTIMGHVDHGKTSLLDHIRKTRVAAGEAGGITQHIGAYHVTTKKGVITFLDTPGHAAFTRMRARGAQVTDIVVLVVASDDGVMPQTKEAILHARAANAPIVVAITKIDKPEADLDRVKNELSREGVMTEDWGGDVQFVGVSAFTGAGIDELLDAILLQAEVMELRAPIEGPARGSIVESSVEKGRGPVATVLVRSGTLHQGDVILTGQFFGRVRAMFNEAGVGIREAGPSIPVAVLGLSGAPEAGDEVIVVADERKARELADLRESRLREAKLAQTQAVRMDQVFARMGEGEQKTLNLIIKADVQGSAEALTEALGKMPSEEVRINVLSATIGGISESDIDLALASRAIIIGFNVRADGVTRRRISETGVDVRYYSIIYDVLDDVADAVSGLLGTEVREQIVGIAQVRDVFRSSKLGNIAGCLVIEGEVRRGLPIRVLRNQVVIYEGDLESLRRFKDDVNKVEAGTECGIGVKNYNDVKVGDQIECFERIEVRRTVKSN